MIVPRDLNVHHCFFCKKPMDDEDFVRCGVGILPKTYLFFDYICHRCSHHGRYVVNLDCNVGPVEAHMLLADLIQNGEPQQYRADWDAIDWGNTSES
ncbi:MAG TPA: hypothetical protein VGP72_01785 [Planctomycetota bacterium]|jgi:hypothetical protein